VGRYIIYESKLQRGAEFHGFDMRWHRETDLPAIAGHFVGMDYIASRLGMGARIAVAEFNGAIAGWRFYMPSPCPQSPFFMFHAPQDAIFGFAAFVMPDFRGKRAFSAITTFAAGEFLNRGYARLFSTTNMNNSASRKAHTHAGENAVMEIRSAGILGLRFVQIDGKTNWGYWTRRRRYDVYLT